MSGLGWLIKDYVETREGRIKFGHRLWLFVDSAGKKIREKMWNGTPWPDKQDANGDTYSLYKGRSVNCPHPTMWAGQYPVFPAKHTYSTIPAKDCLACKFHEPKRGRRRYPCCVWFRENSGMESPLAILNNSVKQAKELLK